MRARAMARVLGRQVDPDESHATQHRGLACAAGSHEGSGTQTVGRRASRINQRIKSVGLTVGCPLPRAFPALLEQRLQCCMHGGIELISDALEETLPVAACRLHQISGSNPFAVAAAMAARITGACVPGGSEGSRFRRGCQPCRRFDGGPDGRRVSGRCRSLTEVVLHAKASGGCRRNGGCSPLG